jgi:hypothetical protein
MFRQHSRAIQNFCCTFIHPRSWGRDQSGDCPGLAAGTSQNMYPPVMRSTVKLLWAPFASGEAEKSN